MSRFLTHTYSELKCLYLLQTLKITNHWLKHTRETHNHQYKAKKMRRMKMLIKIKRTKTHPKPSEVSWGSGGRFYVFLSLQPETATMRRVKMKMRMKSVLFHTLTISRDHPRVRRPRASQRNTRTRRGDTWLCECVCALDWRARASACSSASRRRMAGETRHTSEIMLDSRNRFIWFIWIIIIISSAASKCLIFDWSVDFIFISQIINVC